MKRPIIQDKNFLKQKSDIITDRNEINAIIKDLEDSLDIKKGFGLSAIQIGIKKQISIIRHQNLNINLINAIIIEKNKYFRFTGEGCLSFPGLYIDTKRYSDIVFENEGKQYAVEGIEAIVIQHELDHCQGLTMFDRKWRAK